MDKKSVYEQSEWAKSGFAQSYVDNAEGFILERRRLLTIMKSFYNKFIKDRQENNPRILDLGCGDGILSRELLQMDGNIAVTLVDGSNKMIETAKGLIGENYSADFVSSTFQDLIEGKTPLGEFDFVVSSLAIHHITFEEKKKLYNKIYSILSQGGAFMNIDVVAADHELEAWYLELWEEWVAEREKLFPVEKSQSGISRTYKKNKDNLPDTLDLQLEVLRQAGFKNVDCFYKYGIFTIFGGFKQER